MARIMAKPPKGQANMPAVAMWDALELALSSNVNPGATAVSQLCAVAGARRYRLKVVQLTGAGPTRVRANDIPFSRTLAQVWEQVVLAAAMVTATRTVFNFGEGTAILTNFMGPYLAIDLQNNGGDVATYEVELWAQW